MEEGDHSECRIELLTCPEHREEQLRKMADAHETAADAEEANIPEGWEALFRPMTSAERIKFEAKRQFMDEVVFVGLKNLNTEFDAPRIQHFLPADFGEVINRCERLNVTPIGIEIFTTDGCFVDCQIRPEDICTDEVYDWARRLVEKYKVIPEMTMTFTFDVPDSLLNLSSLSAVENVEPSSDDYEPSEHSEPTESGRRQSACEEEK
jgi:hypothetical protein